MRLNTLYKGRYIATFNIFYKKSLIINNQALACYKNSNYYFLAGTGS
ncbi:hypothetical protein FM106_01435 [Brachybacterium faecium]|nr:hypothetical protein FM106_01435 [Brachybacterium faecium]